MIYKLISGGQTGVDRGALEAAIELGIKHGGWCPKGRRADDGVIPEEYALLETDTPDYDERTRRNVLDAEGTLILATGPLVGGTQLTFELAQRFGKPVLVVPPASWTTAVVRRWLLDHSIRVLNVAGPRENQAPGIQDRTRAFLRELFSGEAKDSRK
jgi:hypothetical protein